MPIPPQPAYAEEQDGDSDNNRTVPGTKVSANIPKEEKKSSKKQRPLRKEKKSHSDDGILQIERGEDEETVADRVRVIREPKDRENRRRSMASAPVTGGHSPRKPNRPFAGERGVTFDTAIPRHDKNDKRYFGRDNEEISSSKSRQQSIPQRMHPPMRPQSFHGRLPPMPQSLHYQPMYPPVVYAAPSPFASPQMQPSYKDAYFGSQQPNGLAARFGRTGQPTLDTAAPLEYLEPRRETSREPRRKEVEYEDEEHDEDDYYSEIDRRENMRAEAEKERRLEKQRQQRRLLHAAEELLERQRIENIRAMPPPGFPRRESSQRNHKDSRAMPELSYQSIENMREQSNRHSRDARGSFTSDMRPQFTQRDTEAPVRARRPSTSQAPPSSSSTGYSHDLAHRPRQRHPDILEVPSTRRRPSSFYNGTPGTGTSATSSNYEDNLGNAMRYQEAVAGDAAPLTEEVLKKQQRAIGAGSRGTRSSASRDDSDVRRSVTTKTTRSGSGDGKDHPSFTLKGNARVNIDGAEITTRDSDGEIEITLKRNTDQRTIKNGSDASQYGYAPSGTTAVSDDFMARPKASHKDITHSHQYKSSREDVRYAPHGDMRDHPLRDRLNSKLPLGRRNSQRDPHRGINYEQWP